jgi:DNA repair ATPase RecN
VRLVEDPPRDLEPEQFGFHSDYGSHDWRIDEGRLVYERRLEAGADVTTVVGVREVEDPAELIDDVDRVNVTPVESATETTAPRDESAEDASAAEDRAVAGPTVESASVERRAEAQEQADETDAAGAAGEVPSTQNPTGGSTDSLDARIRHLQADVADLRAYSAALEEFLDEHGSASEVVAEFDDRLDAFQDDLAALETRVDANEGAITDVSEDVEAVRESVDDNDDDLEAVMVRLQAVEEQLDDAGDLSTLADRLTRVEADVDEVNRWRESLRSALSAPDTENES